MKKTLSILMSILIIALSFTFLAGAASCDCKDHTDAEAGCGCCFACDNFDESLITSCIKASGENGIRCCDECRGIIPCTCGCPCCATGANGDADTGNGPLLTPEQQEQVVDGFQGVLARIREFFDNLFDKIFEFLRFDEIMGTN